MATFDYTSRDFISIRQDLLARASALIPEFTSTESSDFANTLIDLWAYMGDVLHFYVDRAASEAFLETATQRDSVMAIANLLDYIPSGVRASRGSVVFSLTTLPPLSSEYVIPQYTVLSGTDAEENTYSFYTTSASNAMTMVGQQVTVSVVQGTLISDELLGVSNGGVNQKFNLVKKNVDVDSVVVSVMEGPVDNLGNPTAVEYQYVPQISSANYLDKIFTARVQSDGSTQIQFGNGFNGSVPSTNASMYVDYRTTAGSSGNLNANRITVVSGVPSSYVSIVSATSTSGGADRESIESIKTNVSRLYRTQDRAVSLQDYKDLALQTPGVSKATAVFNAGSEKTLSTCSITSGVITFTTSSAHNFVAGQKVAITGVTNAAFNISSVSIGSVPTTTTFTVEVADYTVAPTGSSTGGTATTTDTVVIYPAAHQTTYPPSPTSGQVLLEITQQMAEYIEAYFSTRSMLGVTAVVVDPLTVGSLDRYISCVPVYVRLKVHVLNNYVQSWVKNEVDKTIRELLSFANTSFGQRLTIGEVYRAALSVTGVDYIEILNLNTTYSGADTVATVTDITAPDTQLLCFTDEVSSNVAVTFNMQGGLTGSN